MTRLKNILIIFCLLVLAVSATSLEARNQTSFSFKKLAAKLCENIKADQLFKFKSELRKSKSHIRSIYPQVKCDGKSFMQIAKLNQSDAFINYLNLKAKPEKQETTNYLASTK